MTKKQVLALLWFGVVAVLLIRTALLYVNQPDKSLQGEILLGHGLVMLALAAPLGWPAVFVAGTVAGWFGVAVAGVLDAALISLACGVAGYLQWFVLLPWLWRKWKARRAGGPTSSV
ncbi:MAG: hypothetical protein ACOVOD_08270 [Rhodoferax sp.]|jgi:hypothetical protein